jgi:predicted ATPase
MITKLEINGFKTFENFKITLSPFVVIAGANNSGKSNLFDAIQLLSRLAETDLKSAFKSQRGDLKEIFTQYPNGGYAQSMRFVVEMLVDRQVKDSWGEQKTLDDTRLRYHLEICHGLDKRGLERLYITYEELQSIEPSTDEGSQRHKAAQPAELKPNKKFINTLSENQKQVIYLHPEGEIGAIRKHRAFEIEQTVLSGINNTTLPHAFAVREEMRHWKLMQLNPVELRKPSAILAQEFISRDGANLPTAIARMKANDPFFIKDLSREINNLLPNIVSVDIEKDKQKEQYILVSISQNGTKFSSQVLSEGTLKMIALCAIKLDTQHKGILCFEEPEDGIHPFSLETVALRGLATEK